MSSFRLRLALLVGFLTAGLLLAAVGAELFPLLQSAPGIRGTAGLTAGFLAGLTRSADYVTCARLGGLAAAEVIQHYGARPQANLRDLAAQCGMI